ncbi:MAG: hypothetical protein K6E80_07405 [Schwartzia sp.]|nr:hypothetical protein [Schwartzia sp. (in: firmicutes)]
MVKPPTDLNKYREDRNVREWVTAEVICLKCLFRYIGTFPESVRLKELECPECGKVGSIIMTGQDLIDTEQE